MTGLDMLMMLTALISAALFIIGLALLAGFLTSGGAGIIIGGLAIGGSTTAMIGGVSGCAGVIGAIVSSFYFFPKPPKPHPENLKCDSLPLPML